MYIQSKVKKKDSKPNNTNSAKTRTPSISLLYIRGMSEKLTPIFQQHVIGTFHQFFNTLRSLLGHSKDKTRPRTTRNVVRHTRYVFELCSCCNETYTGVTGRTLSLQDGGVHEPEATNNSNWITRKV